jgi:hypothetical protein
MTIIPPTDEKLKRYGPETNNGQFTPFDLCDLEK